MTERKIEVCPTAWKLYDAYTAAINGGITADIDAAWDEYVKHFESCEKCTAKPTGV